MHLHFGYVPIYILSKNVFNRTRTLIESNVLMEPFVCNMLKRNHILIAIYMHGFVSDKNVQMSVL